MSRPSSIEISVLRWAPPVVHGVVRDLPVRWALEEAGWAYREHVVGAEEQRSDAYRARQPFGQVPAFQSDSIKLFESGAIVLHIAEQSPALLPQEPAERARAMSWIFAALNSVETPVMTLITIDMLYQGPKGDDVQGLRGFVVDWVEARLDTLVRELDGRDYLLDRFTAADLLMTTVLRGLRDTDLVESRPTLQAYQRRCEARPAFQKALADHLASFARNAPAAPK